VVTSPSGAEALAAAAGGGWPAAAGHALLIAIGDTTARRLAELGRGPDAIAGRPTAEGIREVVEAALSAGGARGGT
jgi:uroporphyrinogen-III synthase